MPNIMDSLQIASLTLSNRVVMAPMTRSRARDDETPGPSTALYYAQRASAGLIISEGTQVSSTGRGYLFTPGLYTAGHVAEWRNVTDAVHAQGGHIFAQLWHTGRVSHPYFHEGAQPAGPSALPVDGIAFTPEGPVPVPVPREFTITEIASLVDQFAHAAGMARRAGFDGIELHGANGYLLDQFLRDGANRRRDAYGGSIENRARLPLEIVEAVTTVWEPERVSYRVSPHFAMYSMSDSDPGATFGHLARALSGKIGQLHVVEPVAGPAQVSQTARLLPALKSAFGGLVIANGGYDAERARQALASGEADLISFGLPFIANPDLPERLSANHPLTQPDAPTIYGGNDAGYIDYPMMGEVPAEFQDLLRP